MALKFVGTFVLTDDSLDRHSERVLPSGVQLDSFKSNPLMFYNHHRSTRWNDADSMKVTPIGIWKDIKKRNNTVIADAYIDEDDEFAVKIGKKIENGILRAVSIGFKALGLSDDPKDKLPGQYGYTITKCEIREASIVDIPANANALMVSKSISEKSIGDIDFKSEDIFFHKNYDNQSIQNGKISKRSNDMSKENKKTSVKSDGFANWLIDWVKSFFQMEQNDVDEIKTEADVKQFLEKQKTISEQLEDAKMEQLKEVKVKYDALIENIKSVEDRLASLLKDINAQFAKIEEKVSDTETSFLEKLSKQKKTLEKQIDNIKTSLDLEKEKIEAIASDVNSIKGVGSGGNGDVDAGLPSETTKVKKTKKSIQSAQDIIAKYKKGKTFKMATH